MAGEIAKWAIVTLCAVAALAAVGAAGKPGHPRSAAVTSVIINAAEITAICLWWH